MDKLPPRKILAATIIDVLRSSGKPMKASIINDEVARVLNISPELLALEDTNCTGTEYAYQMRWIRTNLKNKGQITSPTRGYWLLVTSKE